MDISIVIATCDREASLRRTVASIQSCDLSGLQCEVVIVANGGSATPSGLSSTPRCEITLLHEPRAGKSRALNLGMQAAKGRLLVFTDDDVIVSPPWLRELHSASLAHPDEVAFCGPIRPQYPPGVPTWLRSHSYTAILYADFQPKLLAGPLPPHLLPFGPNWAIRASASEYLRYRLDLGPSEENGALMCEDTAFTAEVRDRFSIVTDSGGFIYVPSASVSHIIGEHKGGFSWIMDRFFSLGRSRMIRFGRITHICRKLPAPVDFQEQDPSLAVISAAQLNFYCGQFAQCSLVNDELRAKHLLSLLQRLDYAKRLHVIAPSALRYLTLESGDEKDAMCQGLKTHEEIMS